MTTSCCQLMMPPTQPALRASPPTSGTRCTCAGGRGSTRRMRLISSRDGRGTTSKGRAPRDARGVPPSARRRSISGGGDIRWRREKWASVMPTPRRGSGLKQSSLREDTESSPSSSPSATTTTKRRRDADADAGVVVGSVVVMGVAAIEFGLLAFDVQTTHVFSSWVDPAVRAAVLATTSEEVRTYVAPRVVSNIFPLVGFSWLIASSLVVVFQGGGEGESGGGPGRGLGRRVTVAWIAHALSFVAVGSFKELFARARPASDQAAAAASAALESMHTQHNYAFPSGHTCGANVLTGLALFVLMDPTFHFFEDRLPIRGIHEHVGMADKTAATEPVAAAAAAADDAGATTERSEGQDEDGGSDQQLSSSSSSSSSSSTTVTRQPAGTVALWLAATVITAAARIEGDRHWLSDTMAGAALGIFFVSGSLVALRLLDEKDE